MTGDAYDARPMVMHGDGVTACAAAGKLTLLNRSNGSIYFCQLNVRRGGVIGVQLYRVLRLRLRARCFALLALT